MADFTRTTINQSARRDYTVPIETLDTFLQVCANFENEVDIDGGKTRTSESFKTKIVYFNTEGDEAGSVTLQTTSQSAYTDGKSVLCGTEIAEAIAGNGGAGSEDEDQTWAVKFAVSYVIPNTENLDSFTVTIGNKYMLISNYSYDASLEAVEAWADNQNALA